MPYSARESGGYSQVNTAELLFEESPIHGSDDDGEGEHAVAPTDTLDTLQGQLEVLGVKEVDLQQKLEDYHSFCLSRQKPFEDELQTVQQEMAQLSEQIQETIKSIETSRSPRPPGPACISWVSGSWFATVCNCVVVLNMFVMFVENGAIGRRALLFNDLDQVFLTWYVLEISAKFVYHRDTLLLGKVSVVWWNWLDLGIVLGGILDQWLIPLMLPAGQTASPVVLGWLHCMRLFRLLRILRILRAFLQGDMAWAETSAFEVFMSGVIALNSVVMSLELDIEWTGWLFVENAFLVVYSFELSLRLKKQGCYFLVDTSNLVWNYLDTVMVVGGVLDLWLMPLIRLVRAIIFSDSVQTAKKGSSTNFMSLLKMMRILRVLRLVKLFRAIKPLYRLLLGVIDSLKAMQWVIVLTLLMLYSGAIFWTSLVGKGLMYGGAPPQEGLDNFGSVPRSLFSLFRLMNGDTDVGKSVTTTVLGQLLFAAFMVLANWAILAILTSVVSDNMIAASLKASQEDQEQEQGAENTRRMRRLRVLFREIDTDQSGTISESEWDAIFKDAGLSHELRDATSLGEKELRELFACIAVESKTKEKIHHESKLVHDDGARTDKRRSTRHHDEQEIIHYNDFIEHLKDENQPADKRSVLQLMVRIQHIERSMEARFGAMLNAWESKCGQLSTSTTKPEVPPASVSLGKQCALHDSDANDVADGQFVAEPVSQSIEVKHAEFGAEVLSLKRAAIVSDPQGAGDLGSAGTPLEQVLLCMRQIECRLDGRFDDVLAACSSTSVAAQAPPPQAAPPLPPPTLDPFGDALLKQPLSDELFVSSGDLGLLKNPSPANGQTADLGSELPGQADRPNAHTLLQAPVSTENAPADCAAAAPAQRIVRDHSFGGVSHTTASAELASAAGEPASELVDPSYFGALQQNVDSDQIPSGRSVQTAIVAGSQVADHSGNSNACSDQLASSGSAQLAVVAGSQVAQALGNFSTCPDQLVSVAGPLGAPCTEWASSPDFGGIASDCATDLAARAGSRQDLGCNAEANTASGVAIDQDASIPQLEATCEEAP
eukprot:CAMPEP_0203892470 /NCGR_PEP_ID=MMETSP0359-20131031/35658_1 /ASSEMBLY_ACC=CAM_ASM_000338 /TAXON_ID=268821 /ORGANISM="Scrippsiella Hangoei, Strain SHTV-5" /LENGTH=1055 /DNA_ID=CAMNT_0050814441 /DNA_START=50 /DNA_END=3213 /DNA_ORIENTATION=-